MSNGHDTKLILLKGIVIDFTNKQNKITKKMRTNSNKVKRT